MLSSIIIPTCGRPVAVKKAISSVQASISNCNFAEILVVDNNQSEFLSNELFKYCKTLGSKINYIQEKSPGLTAARHCGMIHAKGNWLTFIDDDVTVSKDWLTALQSEFTDPNVGMVGGPSIPNFTGSIPNWFWTFISPTPYGGWICTWLSLLDIGRDVDDFNPDYIFGLNFSIRKDVLIECGGFHPDLVPNSMQRWQGDGETGLTKKVSSKGYRSKYSQQALLFHECGPERLNFEYFKRRAYYQGVCNSFMSIRSGAECLSSYQTKFAEKLNFIPSFIQSLRKQVCSVNGGLHHKILREIELSQQAGFKYHQNQVANDPKLKSWVIRDNYFDADIRNEI